MRRAAIAFVAAVPFAVAAAAFIGFAAPNMARAADPAPKTMFWHEGEGGWVVGSDNVWLDSPAYVIAPTSAPGSSVLTVSAYPAAGSPPPLASAFLMRFEAPTGQAIVAGTYAGATRGATASAPAIDISRESAGCNQTHGGFVIRELHRDAGGAIDRLAVTLEYWCSATADYGRMAAEIRFNSAVPVTAYRVDAVSLAIPATPVGTQSAPVSVRVTNIGEVPIAGTTAFTGTSAADFASDAVPGCLANLDLSASCAVAVRVTPSAQGARTAVLGLQLHPDIGPRRVNMSSSGQLPTSTRWASAPATSVYPSGTTAVAEVSAGPTYGLVRFECDGAVVGSAGISAGVARGSLYIEPGSCQLVAHYMGNPDWAASTSSPTAHTAVRESRLGIQMAASAAPGEPVTIVGSLEVAGAEPPTGTLSLLDYWTGDVLGTAELGRGVREVRAVHRFFDSSTLVRLRYAGGDPSLAGEIVRAIQIKPFATTTSVVVPATSLVPDDLVVRALVTPVPDGGSVSFQDGPVVVGTAPVDPVTGTAQLTVRLPAGVHGLSASFAGSRVFDASASTAVSHTRLIPTSVSVDASPNPVLAGDEVTIWGTVAAGASAPDDGTLAMRIDGAEAATEPVTPLVRRVSLATQTLAVGLHTVRVDYIPGGVYAASSSVVIVDVRAQSTDHSAPAGNVAIDHGATYTDNATVGLTLAARDPEPGTGVSQMQFSSTGAATSWEPWLPFATAASRTLAGADGSKWVYVRYRDAAGNVSPAASSGIVLDRTAPAAAAPRQEFAVGGQITTTIPMIVRYGASDPTSGVAAYSVGQSTNGGVTYAPVATTSAVSIRRSLTPGATLYRFHTRAADHAGNISGWRDSPSFRLSVYQETALRYSTGWAVSSDTRWSGGAMRTSSQAGATATIAFTGSRIAIVSARAPSRGFMDAYLDGVRVATVDLYSPTVDARRIVFERAVAAGTHSLQIRVRGTSRPGATGTAIAVDAVLVAR